MASVNNCVFIGNCTRDPDLKFLPSGQAVAEFSIAVNRKWKTEAGELREEVTFVDFKAWAKRAETIAQYVKKGDPIYIQARYTVEEWEKDDGTKNRRARFVVEEFQFLSSGKDRATDPDESDSATPPPQRKPSSAPRPPADPDLDAQPEDVPF